MVRMTTVLGFSFLALACSESEPEEKAGPLRVFPPKIYSGTDGAHDFRVPVVTSGTGEEVSWSISDGAIATLEPSLDGVMLTMRKAGTARVTAKAGGFTAHATLTVKSYSPAEHAAGEKRYIEGAGEGQPPCRSCHGAGAAAPDHTPTVIGQYDDEQVARTYQTGIDPEGVPIKQEGHTFQGEGLVPYLRSLTPRGFPAPTLTE